LADSETPRPLGDPAWSSPPSDAEGERPYVFRPAEFRPAVFIPAEVPHRDDASSLTAGPRAIQPPSSVTVKAKGSWSPGFARVAEELVAWFKTLVSAAVYATLIVTFGFQVARVEGQSMVPTLEDQDRLIVNKLAYQLHDPAIGDIVMLYYPEDPSKSFVKRVIGREDDTLRSVGGKVYRNEMLLDDDFIPLEFRSQDTWGPLVVRRGYYFVMGDHRSNSSDSRAWGEVPKRYIIGKVQVRWWPLNHARLF
jgi:signal peptidase I